MGFSTPPLQPPWLFKQLKRVDSKFGIVYPWEIPGWVLCPALILQLTFPLSLCLGLCYAGVCGHFTLSQFARGASCLQPVRVAAHVANGMTACVSSDHKTSSLFFLEGALGAKSYRNPAVCWLLRLPFGRQPRGE